MMLSTGSITHLEAALDVNLEHLRSRTGGADRPTSS